MLDYQRHGLVLLGPAGKIIHMNRAAADIVAQADGLTSRPKETSLSFRCNFGERKDRAQKSDAHERIALP
jgi:hypothetical protein